MNKGFKNFPRWGIPVEGSLGMPLDGKEKRVDGIFQGLDKAVFGRCGSGETRGNRLHGLVMMTVDRYENIFEDTKEPGSPGDPHVVAVPCRGICCQ